MKQYILFLVSAAVCLVPAAAHAESGSPIGKTQQRAFQLGLMMGLPQERTVKFLHDVKALREAPDGPAALTLTAKLTKDAAALRLVEARSYAAADGILKTMGAAPTLRAWAGKTAAQFNSPVVMSGEAKPYLKKQPNVAAILATIDEAEAAAKAETGYWKSIEIWLRLSYGKEALWALRTGDLAASLHAPNADELRLDHLPTYADVLKTAAPSGTPAEALNALESISIPALIRSRDAAKAAGKPGEEPASIAVTASATLIDTFGAQEIVKSVEGL